MVVFSNVYLTRDTNIYEREKKIVIIVLLTFIKPVKIVGNRALKIINMTTKEPIPHTILDKFNVKFFSF